MINVDVYFEEQGIHSIDPASEFYITIYGSIAQSESENISANVKWGKAQSAKQGNVPFQCKHFLGYTKNADGEIEIVPEEAEIIREIYDAIPIRREPARNQMLSRSKRDTDACRM